MINEFISSKEVEGCSERTIEYYQEIINKLAETGKEFANYQFFDMKISHIVPLNSVGNLCVKNPRFP